MEINNPFLKDGLRIIIPPDIATDPGTSNHLQLKSMHTELYTKRSSILKSFNPVYFYSIDRLGKKIFCDNICGNMAESRSDEDFWSTFNLYDMSKSVNVEVGGGKCDKERLCWTEGRGEPAVFNAEVRTFFINLCLLSGSLARHQGSCRFVDLSLLQLKTVMKNTVR